MRTLYHFAPSPFSTRTRLALAHKGLDAELRECRMQPEQMAEVRRLVAVKTLPVLVDGPHVLSDSTAITRWLDGAYPNAPRIWPEGDDARDVLEITTLVDVALDALVNIGTRYYPLRADPAWDAVKGEVVGRAQKALDAIGVRAAGLGRPTFAKSGWSAADMWVLTASDWLAGLPGRVTTSPNAAQLVEVGGWAVPEAVARWAEQHAGRADRQRVASTH